MLLKEIATYSFCSAKDAIRELRLHNVYKEIYGTNFEDTLYYEKQDHVDDHDIPQLERVLSMADDIFDLEIDGGSCPIVIKITWYVARKII